MSEATKNSIKTLSIMFGSFGAFLAIAYGVPDDSIYKKIFAYILGGALFLAILYFTPLGNPIKDFIRKHISKDKSE